LLDAFFELMMDNPSPQQVLDFKASPEEEVWIANLIERSKEGRITAEEQAEIDYFFKIERAITLAKIKAFVKLKRQGACAAVTSAVN